METYLKRKMETENGNGKLNGKMEPGNRNVEWKWK